MKSILVGNGINIEFGGKDYSNSEIIKRLISNLETKDYSEIFNYKLTSQEFKRMFLILYNEIPNVLKGTYDSYCKTDDEFTLIRFKKDYTNRTSMFNIGMEDYFFILHLISERVNYERTDILDRGSHDGLCFLLLDAIFNNGYIQTIYHDIKPTKHKRLKQAFSKFDSLFTVNYDCNIETISGKPVYHLHGEFNTLYDQYDPSTYIGKLYDRNGEHNPVTSDNRHIYCNAIMGFNGPFKNDILMRFENSFFAIEQVIENYRKGLVKQEEIQKLKDNPDPKLRFAGNIIEIAIMYPNLTYGYYPSKNFREINDELYILGLSPNNDEHIWAIIKENHNLNKILYYYKTEFDRLSITTLYPDMNVTLIPVEDFWNNPEMKND